ncbi:MAG: glycine-rich domain-containing protein [Eubacteriales bacterium]
MTIMQSLFGGAKSPYSATYLIVAGGGGGAGRGGCGAGGFLSSTSTLISGTTYTITIGAGGVGDMLGLWTRGEVMGMITKGELFSQYNVGNVYTSGTQVDIVNTGSERVAAYSVTASEMLVYDRGYGNMNGTEVYVPFDKKFAALLSKDRPVVTITAMGQAAQIYLKSVTEKGFTVASNDFQNIEFSWIAVGERVDAETSAHIPQDMLDNKFDENLESIMFNENITERNAKAMWWDGSRIQFGKLPEFFNKTDKNKREEK